MTIKDKKKLISLCKENGIIIKEANYNPDASGEWDVEFGGPNGGSLTIEQWDKFVEIRDEKGYKEKRKDKYPDLSEFADAYYWLQQGDETLMNVWIEKCKKVKIDYPK